MLYSCNCLTFLEFPELCCIHVAVLNIPSSLNWYNMKLLYPCCSFTYLEFPELCCIHVAVLHTLISLNRYNIKLLYPCCSFTYLDFPELVQHGDAISMLLFPSITEEDGVMSEADKLHLELESKTIGAGLGVSETLVGSLGLYDNMRLVVG